MRTARLASRIGGSLRRAFAALLMAWLLICGGSNAHAGSPRFVAGQGQGWNIPAWYIVGWFRTTVSFYTDAGPLSANVSHARADAMVAGAAAVWNVPTSSVTLAKGGELAEDVSSANSSFDGEEVVFPADVQVGNEAAVPVAIVYDADGSLIDLLLGAGASEPDSCAGNAVVGDVDDIHEGNGEIAHATLILNGRCVGAAPEQLTQMQYQLARAFGRVLGLSWSQTNDNVFTAQNTVTANQVAFWPLMHPIDLICSNFTYQCMTNPFTLRADDLNTLAQLYPIYQSAVPAGKQGSGDDALYLRGLLSFPTGQGMEWANITTRRNHGGAVEDWQTVSAMTGFEYQQARGTPIDSVPAVNSGFPNAGLDALFIFRRIPLDGISDVFFTAEPINPLYIGDAAIGPYPRLPVTPSGSSQIFVGYSATSNGDNAANIFPYPDGAAPSCNPGADGTESAPASLDPSGWQQGQLCAWGHSSWWSVAVAAGHTWSMEVTATDETGAASLSKAMPVMGAWQANDATGSLPTVSAEPVAFNSLAFGMTQMAMDAPNSDTVYRIAVSDQFGAGRPDFTYTARVLYADHVVPTLVSTSGGRITVMGTGFRPDNQVTVNGVPVTVVSCSPTQIVADVPRMAVAEANAGVPVEVAVIDPETAGRASIPQAITYVVLPDLLQGISVPAHLESDVAATVPFAVRVLASDGITPVSGATVTLTSSVATASLAICGGLASCTTLTGPDGVVQTMVNGVSAGLAVLTATEAPGGASVQVSVPVTDPLRAVILQRASHYVAAGVPDTWVLQFHALQDGQAMDDVAVQWSTGLPLHQGTADTVTGAGGIATIVVSTPAMAAGEVGMVTACGWGILCAASTIHAVDPGQWIPVASPSAAQSVPASGVLTLFTVMVTDAAGHPVEHAAVQVYQRVLGWEGPCPEPGRCAAAPVLMSSGETQVSDENGMIGITPLQKAGVPQTVEIAVSTGTQGFLTLTLVKAP